MDEPERPAELSEAAWQATPPDVRVFLALLVAKGAALEARLNQTSQNSSKPPSSDPPSAPPPPVKTPRGKPKAKGAQPGHPDQQRALLPEDQVQQVVTVHPTCCPTCHDMLPATLRPVCLPERQQVWEIPDVQPAVTEYQYQTVCCPGCRSVVTATPSAAIPPGAFGPRVVALIALLHGRYRISNRELVALLEMVWHLPISVGSVAHLQQEASAALAPAHADVQAAVEQATHVHVDETSWREANVMPWLWVAVRAVATLFLLQYGRGKKTAVRAAGRVFRRGGQFGPPQRLQQLGTTAAAAVLGPSGAQSAGPGRGARPLAGRRDRPGGAGRGGAGDLGLLSGGRAQPRHHARHDSGPQAGHVGAGGVGTTPDEHAREPLRGSRAALGGLVDVSRWEGIEPTNNAAERALRPAVLWRKGCYGTQSAGGSRFVERMLTVSATCQQHERPLLPFLVDAVTAYWTNQPAPKLQPAAAP